MTFQEFHKAIAALVGRDTYFAVSVEVATHPACGSYRPAAEHDFEWSAYAADAGWVKASNGEACVTLMADALGKSAISAVGDVTIDPVATEDGATVDTEPTDDDDEAAVAPFGPAGESH